LGAVVSLVSGAAQAQTCGSFHGYIWNLCVEITNDTQGVMTLESKWNLWDNSWGLGNQLGDTTNRPPDSIAAGANILTGSNAPMFGNVHMDLQYVVHDAAGNTLGYCTIDADSHYPGDTSGMTLKYNCDTDPDVADVSWEKDSTATASFTYISDGLRTCSSGLLTVSNWKIINDSGEDVVIAKLAGWNRAARVFEEHDAATDDSLGSDSYKLAVSNVTLRDKKDLHVRTCASEFGSNEPDGSLYLIYQVRSSTTGELGPEVFITWSGTGKVVTQSSNYEVGDDTVTIKGG
jgi:hypothetical protein